MEMVIIGQLVVVEPPMLAGLLRAPVELVAVVEAVMLAVLLELVVLVH
jgi:hypothetical protein